VSKDLTKNMGFQKNQKKILNNERSEILFSAAGLNSSAFFLEKFHLYFLYFCLNSIGNNMFYKKANTTLIFGEVT
jgi:hypothetical protein